MISRDDENEIRKLLLDLETAAQPLPEWERDDQTALHRFGRRALKLLTAIYWENWEN